MLWRSCEPCPGPGARSIPSPRTRARQGSRPRAQPIRRLPARPNARTTPRRPPVPELPSRTSRSIVEHEDDTVAEVGGQLATVPVRFQELLGRQARASPSSPQLVRRAGPQHEETVLRPTPGRLAASRPRRYPGRGGRRSIDRPTAWREPSRWIAPACAVVDATQPWIVQAYLVADVTQPSRVDDHEHLKPVVNGNAVAGPNLLRNGKSQRWQPVSRVAVPFSEWTGLVRLRGPSPGADQSQQHGAECRRESCGRRA